MRRMTPRLRLLVACLLVVLGSCAPDVTRLSWTVSFEDVEVANEDPRVFAWIARGGCDSRDRTLEFELAEGTSTRDSTALAPGKYGFGAEARDLACRAIAFGCVERRLPSQTSAPIELVLRAQSPEPRCAPGQCVAGDCSDRPDAQTTALDGEVDPGFDAGPAVKGLSDAASSLDGALTTDAAASDNAALDAHERDAAGDAASGDCPDGIRRPSGHCYRNLDVMLDFSTAREQCRSWGGARVVVFGSAAEEEWLETAFSPEYDFWLGITDRLAEGYWLLADEYAYAPVYANWESSPGSGTGGDCAFYYAASNAWRVGACTDAKGVLCERE